MHALLREVEMSNRKGLHTQIGKHTSHITAGVTYGFCDYSFRKLVALANDKTVGLVTRHDSIKSKVTTEYAGFLHRPKLFTIDV